MSRPWPRGLLAACAVLAAALPAPAQVYRFESYTSNTGLPSNAVYSIFQDARGYIWFATDGGASRYDGLHTANFGVPQGLADASVRGFLEDRHGHLWILTKGGVSRFDGTAFTTYTTAHGLPSNEVRCGLRARDGSLWFGTSRGLSRFDGSRFTNYGTAEGLPPWPAWSLLEDGRGGLWAGFRGGGLVHFDGSRFRVYGRADGLPHDSVFALAHHPQGGLWLATNGGLVHFDGRRFLTYGSADGLGNDNVSSVLVDKHGRVWAGTFGGGISRLEGRRFAVFDRRHGLPDNYITGLFADAEGNVWCATLWSGAFRFASERFANFTWGVGEGLVTGLAETRDGTLWVSSITHGLLSVDGQGRVRRYGKADGLLEEGLWTVYADSRGRVWTAGLRGVSRREGGAFRSFTLEQMGGRDRVNAIVEDSLGRMWFGCASARSPGLIVWDGRAFTTYSTEHGLAHSHVNSLFRDRAGHIWIGTEEGLSRWDGRRFHNYGVAEGLPNKRVSQVHEDEAGRLWVGTADGLALFEGGSFRAWRTEDGLVNNVVHAVASDGRLVWVGTPLGLSVFDGRQFRSYTVRDGLLSHEVSAASFLRRRDGSLWFGTSRSAARYQPVPEMARELPPRVHLSSVRVGEESVRADGPLSLPHHRNQIAFEFLGLSFTDEKAVRYSYRLEGFERGWSAPSEHRAARFINLPPGQYRFLVKARSAAGLWSEPAAVSLRIRPPLWQAWWFRLGALAVLAALAYAGYAWHIRRLEARHHSRVALLHQMLDSLRVINSRLDFGTVLQEITAQSARLVGAEPGGIGVVEGDRVVFRRLWLRDHWDHTPLSFRLGEGIAGRVAASGHSRIVNDMRTEPDVAFPELVDRYDLHAVMDVPIVDRTGRVVGVLDLRRGPGRPPFSEVERQAVEALAHEAAVAIENAGLYSALEQKSRMVEESLHELERLYRNERDVTRTLQGLDQMKTNFMIVTSHEMRTPLTVLRGYVDVLLEGFLGSLSHDQRHCLEICRRTLDRMVESSNDILQMLELEQGRIALRPVPMDLRETARDVLAEMATFVERRRQRLTLETSGELPLVHADAQKMRVVLSNLVGNAIKFTPDGGHIQVRLGGRDGMVHVEVEDTGVGIEPAHLGHVFDKFSSTRDPLHHGSGTYQFRASGTGLGLAIAKGYVEAHGGRIWAESAGPGQGSRFHVELAAAGAAVESRPAAAAPA